MAIQRRKLLILLIAVQILIQATVVECKFGSFMGGLAGSVVGKLIRGNKVKHHHHYYGTPQTTIERRETLANGCYKQVVKEPDTYNPGKFIETEQLICPPTGQAPVIGLPGQQMPMQQPMNPVAGAGNVIVLSKKTGSYYGNSGNSLLQTGSLLLVLGSIVAYFL